MSEAVIDFAATVVRLIELTQLPLNDEKETQKVIGHVLSANCIPFEREVRLSEEDIPDFMVNGDVAVEVKIKGRPAEHLRQLTRYAKHARVRELVLATHKAAAVFPRTIEGKPLRIASVSKGWL